MSNLLSYKSYNGTLEYSVHELERNFQNAIDEYLEDCMQRNVEPEYPYKGTFNVKISPELHRNIAVYAIEHGKSLNAVVEEAIGNMVR